MHCWQCSSDVSYSPFQHTRHVRPAVAVEGSQPIAYQWRYAGQRLRGEKNPVLRVAAASVAATGLYSCVASNAVGAVTSEAASVVVKTR